MATLGPASERPDVIRELVRSGVDVFRLNFAHGSHDWHETVVQQVRAAASEWNRPVAILGDLSGPKIRLGELPSAGITLHNGQRVDFVRALQQRTSPEQQLTSTYERLIDDLRVGDRILLADGLVMMRVIEVSPAEGRATCLVEQGGVLRSRQGINLPGVALSTPALTEKDKEDLHWALEHNLDFIGLSFVRRAEDILDLRQRIREYQPRYEPWIVAKIEKTEALQDLDRILHETDAVMIARGDLGVEAELARVPVIQKQLIAECQRRRIPVITATQMLDSMQRHELPTRAEVSDVANAILDGTDAVMLSGETAIGVHPIAVVNMMSRIAMETERLVLPKDGVMTSAMASRSRAQAITEAVVHGAGAAADHVQADLLVVATRGGKTALALSKQRRHMPILALTDRPDVARRMALFWGIFPTVTDVLSQHPTQQLQFVEQWGRRQGWLGPGSRIVLVGSSDWNQLWHDMMLVHVVS